ncbi:MAG: hypothetical protein Q8S73_34090 [Deltaproteobacteria bacterium]|nr:hypothetical protein [Myxococcales bacterium]MDP3219179.1 hypothetical protein [Deltaproteobacteria bacterium]
MRRRIWSETLPLAELTAPATLALLARYDVELIAAVRPWDLPGIAALVGACNDAGVDVGLWPMIEDADGRWANAFNAPRFTAFVHQVLDAVPAGARVRDLAVDLEPPFGVVTTALRSPTAVWPSLDSISHARWVAARRQFRALIGSVHERGMQCSAAVLPFVLLDPSTGRLRPVQRALAAPVDALPWDHVSVMLYTSMIEGWSRGLIPRPRALDLLARGAVASRRRFGDAAGVSVGVVDVGALGNEPRYRDPAELAVDVAVSRANGVHTINLFDLGGVLRRGPAEAWLEALSGAANTG